MFPRKVFNFVFVLILVVSLFGGGSRATAMPMSPTDETKVPHYYGPYSNYANSSFTVPDVSVSIVGDGTGATASAAVGANGVVSGVTITNPGSGYTAATVSITGAGSGAAADAVVSTTGVVTAINLAASGAGYTQPTVTITGGGATADATATAYGGVDAVLIGDGGVGYTFPTVDFDLPDAPDGVQAKGHVPAIALGDPFDGMDANGTISAVLVDSPGSGYAKAPGVAILDGTRFNPVAHPGGTFRAATATTTLTILSVVVDTFGAGYTSLPTVDVTDSIGNGSGAQATAVIDLGAVTAINLTSGGTGYITTGGIKKFQDGLPMLCDPSVGCTGNNLGQYIPIAVPDTTTFPGTDYYVIGLVQHREQMNSSLPAQGTLLREYVQLQTSANTSWSKGIPLQNELRDGTSVPAMMRMPDGTMAQAIAVDNPHYMGPIIVAQKDRAVRLVFYNLLPAGVDGDLFIPVDTTFMGAGMGPMNMMAPMDMGSVLDEIRNPMCGEANRSDMVRMGCFAETRATLHLHGGITPWISDGSPHQWITPANEMTGWPEGVAVRQVPDMVGSALPAGVPDCSAADDGCMTFYYTNQQSARLMFYHDHAWGITRLNVYAGEAAGYLIRDNTEQSLIDRGLIPSGTAEIPLVIQDRTFLPNAAQVATQDPTWDYTRWGGEGDLWYEHVYMPAQNPGDPSGMSAYGRWMYGPWFWPPSTPTYGPINNPYYNPNCNLDDPATWQYQIDPFCEPPLIPGTPNNSAGMEQFNDTPIVNGTAYPTTTLEPKSYRFRILNAANDRFWNLQWYVGDPTTADPVLGPTEVALKPDEVAAAQLDPNIFPTPDTTLSPAGPSWIQIGTEGGFLPAPVVVPNQPITWIIDPTRFDVGNVDKHSLLLGPAERADVIVDFSKYAGKTLILYNDAPAAFPARVGSYDYYTGGPDLSPAGAPSTLPGYGPNTRTIMQVKIAGTAASAYNLSALQSAFRHHADGSGVFESGQNPIIVGQAAYNSAYGTSFVSSSWCNAPGSTLTKCDGFARISEQGGDTFKFNTLVGSQIGVKIEPKAIHDEMNSTNFEPFGRMSGNLGVEVVPADPVAQNVVLYPFVNPPTELFDGTNLPASDTITPISSGSDGTQIWKITHNGVDTHPIHFHLYDVQLLNRVTWDNIIIPPEASEIGWKDTVRVSPLEDTIFAIRPVIMRLPWEIPNSIRPLNPMMPLGDTSMFNPTDINGNPTNPIANQLVNFGWEYMLHCHILSHEEMDMMRPVAVSMPPIAPDGLAWSVSGNGNKTVLTLTWNDNSITETSFVVQRTGDGVNWTNIGTVLSPLDQANTHGTRTYNDTTFRWNKTLYSYRVVALNTIGLGGDYPSLTTQSTTAPMTIIQAPSNLTATLQAGPQARLTWTDNAGNESGYVVERSVDGGATFTNLANLAANTTSYVNTGLSLGATYVYRVAAKSAVGMSAYSNAASVTVPTAAPAAPGNFAAANGANGKGNSRTVVLTWQDLSTNEGSFTIQRATNATFTSGLTTITAAANTTTLTQTGLARNTQYWYRIQSTNIVGSSAWVNATPFPIRTNP
jgi:FtsP/CotA-like multicopper oxidase with cupredoxin domain